MLNIERDQEDAKNQQAMVAVDQAKASEESQRAKDLAADA